jgi:hypothetical protein
VQGTESEDEDRGTPRTRLVYDRTTGRILARYRCLDATTNQYRDVDPAAVLDAFRGDETLVSRVADRDPANLATTSASAADNAGVHLLRVEPRSGRVRAQPKLRLRSNRDAIDGDGVDSLTIDIDVVGDRGTVLGSYEGDVKVTTTHGKLSVRAGLVHLERGRAAITLTSTCETIDAVYLQVQAAEGSLAPARLTLRFE